MGAFRTNLLALIFLSSVIGARASDEFIEMIVEIIGNIVGPIVSDLANRMYGYVFSTKNCTQDIFESGFVGGMLISDIKLNLNEVLVQKYSTSKIFLRFLMADGSLCKTQLPRNTRFMQKFLGSQIDFGDTIFLVKEGDLNILHVLVVDPGFIGNTTIARGVLQIQDVYNDKVRLGRAGSMACLVNIAGKSITGTVNFALDFYS